MPTLKPGWFALLAVFCTGVAFAQSGPAAWTNDAETSPRPTSYPSRPSSPYARPEVIRLESLTEANAPQAVQPANYAEPLLAPPAVAAKPDAAPAAGKVKPSGEAAKSAAGIPLARRNTDPPVPLAAQNGDKEAAGRQSGLGSLGTLAGSLMVVLTLFFVVMWLMRRAAPQGAQTLPGEVVEVLGRAPLAGRQQMHLLRCGRKLLLVSVTPDGATTLTEITDPEEVDRLAGLCQQTRPGSATAAFREVFQQFAGGGKL